MPPPDLEGGVPDSSVGSDPTATASSSTLEDIPSLIERAIAKLPPDLAAQAVVKKRKARSCFSTFVGLLNVSVCDCVEHFSSLAYVY